MFQPQAIHFLTTQISIIARKRLPAIDSMGSLNFRAKLQFTKISPDNFIHAKANFADEKWSLWM